MERTEARRIPVVGLRIPGRGTQSVLRFFVFFPKPIYKLLVLEKLKEGGTGT